MTLLISSSVQFSSVAQLCPTLCDPMNRSTPGLPVHHHLPEFTQTHVHRVSDAIQPSHPLSSPSPPAPIPPSIRVFSNESALCIRWPKYWSFSFTISPSNELNRTILFFFPFRHHWLHGHEFEFSSVHFIFNYFKTKFLWLCRLYSIQLPIIFLLEILI